MKPALHAISHTDKSGNIETCCGMKGWKFHFVFAEKNGNCFVAVDCENPNEINHPDCPECLNAVNRVRNG